MKINLRQVGGIVGADDRFDLDDAELTVAKRGEPVRRKRLSGAEQARVHEVARQLLRAPKVSLPETDEIASDSMLTQVDIGHGRGQRRFEVRSGQDAPPELWDLVDAMSEAAKRT